MQKYYYFPFIFFLQNIQPKHWYNSKVFMSISFIAHNYFHSQYALLMKKRLNVYFNFDSVDIIFADILNCAWSLIHRKKAAAKLKSYLHTKITFTYWNHIYILKPQLHIVSFLLHVLTEQWKHFSEESGEEQKHWEGKWESSQIGEKSKKTSISVLKQAKVTSTNNFRCNWNKKYAHYL